MATTAAEVQVEVRARLDKLTADLKVMDGKLDRFAVQAANQTKSVDNSFNKMSKGVKRSLAQMGGAFAALFASQQLINGARDFSKALGEVSTLLPATSADLAKIEENAIRLSNAFGGGASEQLAGYYQAISAGASNAAEATEILESANRVAIGGLTSTATAVDVLTTATNAYAATGLKAGEASDILFTGMKAGKTTISQLSSTLGNVIPIAASLGVGLDEVVAGVAALTTQGQSTAQAVTGVRAILSQVAAPTKQASDAAKALGIEFNTAAIEANGFQGFMQEIIEKTGGNAEAMAKLFGSVEALNAALSFAGGGGDAFIKILDDMENSAGATEAAYQKMAQTLDQRMNVAFGKLGNLALKVGQALLAVVVPALEAIASVAELVSDNFERLLTTAGVAAAFFAGQWVVSLVAAGTATKALSAAMVLLRANLQRLLAATGIGLLIIIAGELVFQFMKLIEASGGFGQALVKLKDIGLEVWDRIGKGGQALQHALRGTALAIESVFLKVWGNILNGYGQMISAIESKLNPLLELAGIEANLGGSLAGVGQSMMASGERSGIASGVQFGYAQDRLGQAFSPLQSLQGTSEESEKIAEDFAKVKDSIDASIPSLEAMSSGTKKVSEEAKKLAQEQEKIADGLASFIKGFVSDLRQGKTFMEAMGNALNRLADRLIDLAIDHAVQALLTALTGGMGGGGGNFLMQGLQFLFGGFRADGGPMSSNKAYMVGERGPEMVVPRTNSMVIPNHAMGMNGEQRIKLDLNVVTDKGVMVEVADEQISRAAPQIVQVSVQQSQKVTRNNMAGYMSEAQTRNL